MAKFQTYFNIGVPKWREPKMGSGNFTVRFVLKGRIVSKKNNLHAVARRKEAKEFLHSTFKSKGQISLQDALAAVDMVKAKTTPNIDYNAFVAHFRPFIQDQIKYWEGRLGHKGVKFPLRKAAMTLKLYFADRYVSDTVNKQQSIQDLLVDCGVLANDDYATLNPINSASASYFKELTETISFISLSFKI